MIHHGVLFNLLGSNYYILMIISLHIINNYLLNITFIMLDSASKNGCWSYLLCVVLGERGAESDGSSLADDHLPPTGDRPDAARYSNSNFYPSASIRFYRARFDFIVFRCWSKTTNPRYSISSHSFVFIFRLDLTDFEKKYLYLKTVWLRVKPSGRSLNYRFSYQSFYNNSGFWICNFAIF